jgi:hypothetical protein
MPPIKSVIDGGRAAGRPREPGAVAARAAIRAT